MTVKLISKIKFSLSGIKREVVVIKWSFYLPGFMVEKHVFS